MTPRGPLIASRSVWPVGQGGFASGTLHWPSGGGTPFRYVYDCGSNRPTLLRRRLREYAPAVVQVDLLLISHLDADHANGIDGLCNLLSVDTVVLPYLDRAACVWAVAAAMDNAPEPGWSLFELLTEPRRWASRRGIRRLIFVQPADGDGGPTAESALGPQFPPPTMDKVRWTVAGSSQVLLPPGPAEALQLDRRSLLRVDLDSDVVWAFVPHVPPLDDALMHEFLSEVTRRIPALAQVLPTANDAPGLPFTELEATLRDPAARKQLKAAYSLIDRDHNAVSLALFSGPLVRSSHLALWSEHAHGGHRIDDGCAGRLFTGDAPVLAADHERSFFATYRDWISRTYAVQLPHHGSVLSVSPRFFDELGSVHYFASVGRNKHGHPSPLVVDWAESAGYYSRVDERDESRLWDQLRLVR